MSSVTFPTAIGGDGSTVTDDDNATTGLRNGGWRTRFIPCFTNLVNIADYVVTYTASTTAFATPPPIGSTTPNTGAFTRVTVTGSTAPANGTYLPGTNILGFATNSSERVRIDASGNVGIGTSSPANKLSVSFTDASAWAANTTTSQNLYYNSSALNNASSTTLYQVLYGDSTTGGVKVGAVASASYSADFVVANRNAGTYQENLRLTSSGNLGLGVTPSAWGLTALQVTGRAFLAGNGNTLDLGNNCYKDGSGNWKYIGSVGASFLEQYAGAYAFYNSGSASGTAGATFSPVAAMKLDASGRLLIGTSSATSGVILLAVGGNQHLRNAAGGTTRLIMGPSSNSTEYGGLIFDDTDGSMSYGTIANYAAKFITNNTERARIDSSGNLLVGTTGSPSEAGGVGVQVYNNGGNSGRINFGKTSTTTDYACVFYYSGTSVGNITYSNTATAYVTSSDQRLKTNVTPAGSAIQSVLDFPVDQFDWISSGEHQDFGAVAQKAINFIPEMVNVPADEDDMWGIDWSKAVPRLIKTVQELSVELNEIKKRLS